MMPDQQLSIALRPSVFRDHREHVVAPLGSSLADIVAAQIPERDLWHLLRVSIGGGEVEQSRWAMIRPKRDVQVEITIVPAGGGGTLRIVLMVAIIAIAIAAGAWIAAPVAAGGLGLGAVAAGVATATVGSAPYLAQNALAPPA